MSKLTNEQTARIFAMYLGCEVITTMLDDDNNHYNAYVTGITAANDYILELQLHDGLNVYEEPTDLEIENCKLLLIPLLAIKERDAVEVAKACEYERVTSEQYTEIGIEKAKKLDSGWIDELHPFAYQYLIQKGYAVPLFIEAGHPDNGKTAIELGIAIIRK